MLTIEDPDVRLPWSFTRPTATTPDAAVRSRRRVCAQVGRTVRRRYFRPVQGLVCRCQLDGRGSRRKCLHRRFLQRPDPAVHGRGRFPDRLRHPGHRSRPLRNGGGRRRRGHRVDHQFLPATGAKSGERLGVESSCGGIRPCPAGALAGPKPDACLYWISSQIQNHKGELE